MWNSLKRISTSTWCIHVFQIIAVVDLILLLGVLFSTTRSPTDESIPIYTVEISNYDHPRVSVSGFGRINDCNRIAQITTDAVRVYDPTFTMTCHEVTPDGRV